MNRKILFDAVRRMLGRGFTRPEIEALDEAVDAAMGISLQDSVPSVPSCRVSAEGIRLIKEFEGCARRRPDGLFEAYPDPGTGGAPWTIGWGATGPGIGPDTVWTQSQCDQRLSEDIDRHALEVERVLSGCPTSQGQFDALVSFHFNTGAIHRATLTKYHCRGEYDLAAAEFGKWRYAGGRILNGLVRRRRQEAAMYLSDRIQTGTLPGD